METIAKKNRASISEAVETMTLNLHPEYFEKIINITQLGKLMDQAQPHVFSEHVLKDRVLNFYEAAQRAAFTPGEIRVGVAAAIILTSGSPAITKAFEPFPCGNMWASSFKQIPALKAEQWAQVNNLVRIFSGRNVTAKKLSNDTIGLYLLDAMRMWVMGSNEVRGYILSHVALPEAGQVYRRMRLEAELADPNLSTMSTQWGTIKMFKQKRHVGVAEVLALFKRLDD